MSTVSILKSVTKKASTVDAWISNIKRLYKSSVVGLDTEWFMDRVTSRHKIGILQLCVEDHCLILQMWRMDSLPSSLSEFLMDANYTFVGVGIEGDLEKLQREFDLNCARSKDLADLAMMKWTRRWKSGLKTLAREVLGMEMKKEKKITLSYWRKSFLTPEQVEYASLDAYASYKIGVELLDNFNNPASTSTMDENRKASITNENRKASTLASSTYLTPYDDGYYSDDDSSDDYSD